MKKAIVHYTGYLLSAVGAVVGVSLLSYYVPPHVYGRVALYIAIGTLFSYVVRESLGAAILRYSENIRDDKRITLYLLKQSLPKLALVFTAIVISSFIYFFDASLAEFLTGMCVAVLLGISGIGEAFLSALHRRTAGAIHINLFQWPRFLLATAFYIFIESSVTAILAGFALGILLSVCFDVSIYRKQPVALADIRRSSLQDNVFSGHSAIVIGFLLWFLTFYERIALEWFYGETWLGVYSVLYQIGFMPVVMLMRSAVTYLFPRMFVKGIVDVTHLQKSNLVLIGIFITLAFMVLQCLHEWLFGWLVGEHYRAYSWLLPWLFLAAMLNACSYFLQAYYYETHAIEQLLRIKAIVALAAFVLVTACVWLAAIQGLVLASLLLSLLLIALSYHYIKK